MERRGHVLAEVATMQYRLFASVFAFTFALFGVGLVPRPAHAAVHVIVPQQAGSAQHVRSLPGGTDNAPLRSANTAGYPVTAYPPIRHPNEAPCVDVLFTPHTPPLQKGQLKVGDFADYSDHPFNYTPPANCPGPYAKIVFKMHFRVTAGRQFDRTAAVWIDATNVYFGTTSEPRHTLSPEWTVERDVTEYAPIFMQPSVGQASVYNVVNSTYTSIIYGRAELDFYPATQHAPPPPVADAVYPLSAGPTGGYVALNGPSNEMTGTFTFPRNVEAAYLDVFLESQGGDEFWYTCFPNDLAQEFNNCGNTPFREGEVAVDGKPAGVAPVYPWIYTGGIDPYLWLPIPGVETLNFKPYRVDLTPFAGQFDDGNPHTIAVSVFNDDNYFNANAALLVYEDHGASQLTGRLVSDGTPAAPTEKVVEHVNSTPSGGGKGKIFVTATHPVNLHGYVVTSHGRVDTTVHQKIDFSNVQKIDVTASEFLQDIAQNTTVSSQTETTHRGKTTRTTAESVWPLTLDYRYVATGSSNAIQVVSVDQGRSDSTVVQGVHKTQGSSSFDTVRSTDTLNFTASGYSPSNGASYQQYKVLGLGGACYEKTIRSRDYVIVSERRGC